MSERQPSLGAAGRNGGAEPAVTRRLLDWIEDLVGCNQEELARKAGFGSRYLRDFAAGKGGRRTIERLAGVVPLPLWVVNETMIPTITVVNLMWREGRRVKVAEEGAYAEGRNGALACATRISVVEFLARRGEGRVEGLIRPGRGRTWAGLHPADARVLIPWLQSLGGRTRRELAVSSGLSHEALRLYETGAWPLETPALRCLAEGAGLPFWLVVGVTLRAISVVRRVAEHARRDELLAGWEGALAAAPRRIRTQQSSVQAGLLQVAARRGGGSAEADRVAAEDLWRRLAGRRPAERILLVKCCSEFHSWSLVERLCLKSEEAASDSAKAALSLALLALRVARLVREEKLFLLQLEGFAFVYIGNARRVAGAQSRAAELLSRGLDLWKAGSGAKHDLLPGWRVLDREASLLRDHRRFDEAMDRLDRALEIAPQEAWGRILINKATVLDQKMEPEASIAVLAEAKSLIDERREPHLTFLRTCMLGVNFCHLGRYSEAKGLLPKVQALAAELCKALNNLRLEWLRARIEAGLGHQEEALKAFVWVQEELEEKKIAYDYALVSCELGEILLAQGRYAEVQDLALKMKWIFTQEGIHPEAAKALNLFRQAAAGQKATPELARSVVRYLYRAQHHPELKYAA